MIFYGYKRSDGKVGIRNHVLLLPVSICASDVARKVHERVKGTITFHNHLGCSQSIFDQECTIRTMAGLAANPNVYATILIALGCENCQLALIEKAIRLRTNKPLISLSIQECGGMSKTIREAARYADLFVKEAAKESKTVQALSDLIIGTECGGSDPTSGIACNPLNGSVMNDFVDEGATVVLSETTEFIGAQHLLQQRARSEKVSRRIKEIVDRYLESQAVIGYDIRQRNPSPGNKKGGITTLEEKSLGCILKAGSRPIENVFDYGEELKPSGLVIMDTPGNDSTSMMGLAAGGCQLIVFTTGQGTPMGNPVVPVFKVCANPKTCLTFAEHLDHDASPIITGSESFEIQKKKLKESMIEIINGSKTKSEQLDFYETSIARVNKYVKDKKVYSYYY